MSRLAKPDLSRRRFLAGAVGGSCIMGLGLALPGCSPRTAVESLAAARPDATFAPSLWYEIDGTGATHIFITKAEMGQHVGTALARIVAEELGAAWSQVRITHVDSHPKWGAMVTGGSWSVHTSFKALSQAGAAGRQLLQAAGAAHLGVAVEACTVADGEVSAGGKSVSFGTLVSAGLPEVELSAEALDALPLKAPEARQLLGKPVAALDIPEKSAGEAVYGLDATLPNMVYAVPLLPPTRYGSVLTRLEDGAAGLVPGFLQTLRIDDPSETIQGWGLVIAESLPSAWKAAEKVVAEWTPGPTAEVDEAALFAEGARLADDPAEGVRVVDHGEIDTVLAGAAKTLSAHYRTASALHFTLEPQNALAHFDEAGHCHIHGGNQWQSLILPVLSKALGLEESDITLHQYALGGGYGRRLFGDQMIPAALAARALGRPVKLVLNRDQDSRFDCVRSPSVCRFDAALSSEGEVLGIDHGVAAGWPTLSMAPGFLAPGLNDSGRFDSFSISGADHWYTLPAHRVRAINNPLAQKTFLPGWLRAVGPGWIGWGVESFMDELAHAQGVDPIDFRLARLDGAGPNGGDGPANEGGALRLRAVLEAVRERSGWGRSLPKGSGLGVAVAHGQERGMPTWTACVAEVAVASDAVSVKKLWQVIDVGTVIDPGGARAQAEGAMLWGLSLALHEGTAFEAGQVRDRNLDRYTPLRMKDVPELDIHFAESTAFPSGLGEPPLIAVAPAIGNAIFAATGKRVRDLPIRLS